MVDNNLLICFTCCFTEPIQCDRQAESLYMASRILYHCASAWGRPHSAVGQKNHCTYTSWTTLAGKKTHTKKVKLISGSAVSVNFSSYANQSFTDQF